MFNHVRTYWRTPSREPLRTPLRTPLAALNAPPWKFAAHDGRGIRICVREGAHKRVRRGVRRSLNVYSYIYIYICIKTNTYIYIYMHLYVCCDIVCSSFLHFLVQKYFDEGICEHLSEHLSHHLYEHLCVRRPLPSCAPSLHGEALIAATQERCS